MPNNDAPKRARSIPTRLVDKDARLIGPENYHEWYRMMMRTYGLYLDHYLGEGTTAGAGVARPPDDSEELGVWIDEQGQLVAIINGTIDKVAAKVIPTNARTVKDVFDALKRKYDPASSSTVVAESTRMLDFDFSGGDSSLKTFDQKMTEFSAILENVKAKNTTIDEFASVILMRSLPTSFATSLKIHSAGKDRPPSIETLNNTLRANIVLKSSRNTSPSNTESALYGSPNRSSSSGSSKKKPPSDCPACHKGRHWASDCRDDAKRNRYFEDKKKASKGDEAGKKGSGRKEKAKVAEDDEDSDATEKGQVADAVIDSFHEDGDGWMALVGGGSSRGLVLDTGATVHLTGDRHLLFNIVTLHKPISIEGLGGSVVATEAGSMAIRTSGGRILTLGKVLILDKCKHTLVSTGALARSFGFNFTIKGDKTTAFNKKGEVVFTATSTNGRLSNIDANVVDPPR